MNTTLVSGSVGLVAGIVLTLVFGDHLPFQPEKASLKFTGPDGKTAFEFNAAGGQVNPLEVLERIFADDALRPGALAWLQSSQSVYSLHDVELVQAIEDALCEPIPEDPLERRLAAAKACAEGVVAAGLRNLAFQHRTPFHYVGTRGNLGVPGSSQDRPRSGHANVCREKGLLGRELEVLEPASGRSVRVLATGYYACPDLVKYPDIQVSEADANRLFQRPTAKYEDVVIVPL